MDYYNEALERDPGDIRTNTAVGNILLKNGDYVNARIYFGKALKRLTKDYTRPSSCEALYLQRLTLKAMGLLDEATDTLYRATWDYAYHSAAYLELARISCIKGDFEKALSQVKESLSTNVRNNIAICLKASIQRKLDDLKGAGLTLANIPDTDPLDFRVANENYLIAKESGDLQEAEKLLAGLNIKMRNFDQNYLELAIGYLNEGLFTEAEDIHRRFYGKNPIIYYYLGYIQDKNGNKEQAEKLFKAGSELSVDYCFPFRLETIKILNKVLEYNPGDSKAYYYIGNILYDKQPDKAMESWDTAVSLDPEMAIAHRNLGWGYFHHEGDGLKAIAEYEKAISLNKEEPIYFKELDILYEMSNSPIEKRLKIFEAGSEVTQKRDGSFVRMVTVITLGGELEKAKKYVEYLSGRNFSYREGFSIV